MDISRILLSEFYFQESECRHGADHSSGHRNGFSLKRFLVCAALVLIASLMSVSANASLKCTTSGTNKAVDAGSISVPANAAVGTTVAVLPPDTFLQSCAFTESVSASGSLRLGFASNGKRASGFADVYETNVQGIGIRYTFSSAKCNFSNAPVMYNVDCTPILSGSIGEPPIPVDLIITVSFVVIGAIAPGASPLLTFAPLVIYDYYFNNYFWVSDYQGNAYSGSATGKFIGSTCSVNRTEIPVSLPTADTRAFSAGIGTVAASQSFNLSLACSAGSKVAITLTDNVNPANVSNTLQLSPGSTAKGIGIQILNSGGLPISFGPDSAVAGNTNQWMIGDAPNGQLNVPLIARYIRTGTVSAGTVKALATFTLSYQ
jgi:type 1 fimbria pilin